MIRISRTRLSFRGWRGSSERASEISQRALREVARVAAHAEPTRTPGRIELTVRVPHAASDGAIAARVADAVSRRIRRGTGA
jgi:hypothetical protein